MLFSPPPYCSKRLVFIDLEYHVPFFNGNRHIGPAQVKAVTLTCQNRGMPGNQGFWNETGTESHSHTPSNLEAFNQSISATGKSCYRAERLEENSTWYQSTRTETVSKLIDLSSSTTVTLSTVCFPALRCWKTCEMLLCRFPNIINWKMTQLNVVNLAKHLIPVDKTAIQRFCPL